ncbi:uncharacterized protein JCM6883_003781 [Sporobolomyces salmoneus]|uniref:uncharacterized protein n=1 Tax=Sporobolomyces salmoneus TaxID=183962 RepID=UPI00317532A7
MSSRASSSEYESTPSPTPSERAAQAKEFEHRLKTRLQYAAVKAAQSRPLHSSTELANLTDNPFKRQAEARQREKTQAVVEKVREGNRIEEDEEQIEEKDRWETLEWFQPVDEQPKESAGQQEEEEDDDLESVPTPSPIFDLPPQEVPYLAICPSKPPSNTREDSVDTVVEGAAEEPDNASSFSGFETDHQAFHATELMLSLRHGTSFTESHDPDADPEPSMMNTSRSHVASLLPHKHDSPFSASHPITTTLAPATTTFSLVLPSVLDAPLLDGSSAPSSQETDSQNKNSSSFPISSQASFSALPPPPPLPFSDQPISSQQERQQRLEARNKKRAAEGTSEQDSLRRKGKRQKKNDTESQVVPTFTSSPVPPTSSVNNSPSRQDELSPPPSSFPFSSTQSSTNSHHPEENTSAVVKLGGGFGESQDTEVDMGESQETVSTEPEGGEFESQETQVSRGGFEESQESV